MDSRRRGRRGRPRGASQAPPVFDQQAFAQAVGIAATIITQACTMVSQGRSNNLQRLEAHHPSMAIEGGVDDIRGIQDMGAGTKKKEYHSSSNSGKEAEGFWFTRISGTGPRLSGPRPRWGIWSGRTGDMLFMPTAWTYETGLPPEARIPRFWGSAPPVISGTGADTVYFSTP